VERYIGTYGFVHGLPEKYTNVYISELMKAMFDFKLFLLYQYIYIYIYIYGV
jgi:hypothetical protein